MSQEKIILTNPNAKIKLAAGVQKLADVAKHTLGPKGKHILLSSEIAEPIFSDDGKTIADKFQLEDEVENEGARIARMTSEKTNNMAGDGTTTSLVLTNKLVQELVSTADGFGLDNPRTLKEDILAAKDHALTILDAHTIEITSREQVEDIATISAGDPEVGRLIGEIYEKLGKEGVITHQSQKKLGMEAEITKGMQLTAGMSSPYLATDKKQFKTNLTDAPVLVVDTPINSPAQLSKAVDLMKGKGGFVLIYDSMADSVLDQIVVTSIRGFTILAVKCPYYGERRQEVMEDIAIATGGEVVSDTNKIELASFGSAERLEVTMNTTTIIGGKGDQAKITERAEQIKFQIENSESDFQTLKLKDRLAKLTGGIGVIRIGTQTEAEQNSKMAKVEDSINAVRAALDGGIIGGCGIPLWRASFEMLAQYDKATKGANILALAMREPLAQILQNCDWNLKEVTDKISPMPFHYGFDAKTGEYGDLIEMGVIDPVNVTKAALLNSVSVALMIYSTEGVIVPKKEELEKPEGF